MQDLRGLREKILFECRSVRSVKIGGNAQRRREFQIVGLMKQVDESRAILKRLGRRDVILEIIPNAADGRRRAGRPRYQARPRLEQKPTLRAQLPVKVFLVSDQSFCDR